MFGEIPISSKLYNFLPVIPVYLIIITVNVAMFKWYIFDGSGIYLTKAIFTPIFIICSFMTCVCHTFSMVTDPGKVEPNLLPSEVTSSDSLFCKKCNKRRPERAHHCKICQRCVLKMDHHCPWVANCVGFYNQKYFYQFLFYATTGDGLAFLCLLTRLFYVDLSVPELTEYKPEDLTIFMIVYIMRNPLILIVGTLTSFAMTTSIGFLFLSQSKMISNNLTTIEEKGLKKMEDNPYYFPDKLFNMKIVLGMTGLVEWFIPSFQSNNYNNGYYFTTPSKERESNKDKSYLVLGEETEPSVV